MGIVVTVCGRYKVQCISFCLSIHKQNLRTQCTTCVYSSTRHVRAKNRSFYLLRRFLVDSTNCGQDVRNNIPLQVFESANLKIRCHSGHEIRTSHLLHYSKQEVEVTLALLQWVVCAIKNLK